MRYYRINGQTLTETEYQALHDAEPVPASPDLDEDNPANDDEDDAE